MAPGKFEQLCKMTRIGPEPLSTKVGPPPVKFRPIYFDQCMIEDEDSDPLSQQSNELQIEEKVLQTDIPFSGQKFFKDPLHPSYENVESDSDEKNGQEESYESPSKLGHNMRACGSKKVNAVDKTVWAQMEARKQLLEDQRKHHEMLTKKDSAHKEATALLSNLLQQGFQITPPDETPRLTTTDSDDCGSGLREERQLVISIHKELKRMQGDPLSSCTNLT